MKSFLYETCSWSIGDRRLIDMWNDSWVESGFHIADLDIQIPAQAVGVKLCDLVNENGDWKWQVFQGQVSNETQYRITACIPPRLKYGNNTFITYDPCICEFSMKDMYNTLCNMENGRCEISWKNIWNLNVPEQIRYFVWLLAQDRMVTSFNTSRMEIS